MDYEDWQDIKCGGYDAKRKGTANIKTVLPRQSSEGNGINIYQPKTTKNKIRMNLMPSVTELAELAQASSDEPLDFSGLNLDEMTSYKLMASHVLELYTTQSGSNRDIILMSTITRLLVENFILNLELQLTKSNN